jgi:hypothetical protein
MKVVYAVRGTVPLSAEIEAGIEELLLGVVSMVL